MSKNPNIVLIMTDDQGPWALGCAGTPELRTPVLDQMAAEGTRFENFYCASPVCSAARAAILPGRIPSNHGVLDLLRGGAIKGDQKHKRRDPALNADLKLPPMSRPREAKNKVDGGGVFLLSFLLGWREISGGVGSWLAIHA